jgi:hypothetical protein
MDIELQLVKIWGLSVALAASTALGLMSAPRVHAEDDGFYAGRSLATGTPAAARVDKGQLALEPGSVALAADAARLDSERIFGGYRFGRSFALEGAQTRFGAPASGSGGETLSLAAVSSLPLSDSVTLVAKFGLHYPQSTLTGADRSSADLAGAGKVYGVGVSVQVAENVELRAHSERFERSPGSPQGTAAADSFLLGANVRF